MSASLTVTLRVVRILIALIVVLVIALVFVGSLVMVQGQRDEARPVDALVVLHADVPTNAHIEHALALYQRRFARRVLLVGSDLGASQAELIEQGVPEHALLVVEPTSDGGENFRDIAEVARQQGVQSILIVSAPGDLLLSLKMARDQGLMAYGSPVSTGDFEPRTLFQASLKYWGYVLLGLN